jgi:hypothetical protein
MRRMGHVRGYLEAVALGAEWGKGSERLAGESRSGEAASTNPQPDLPGCSDTWNGARKRCR